MLSYSQKLSARQIEVDSLGFATEMKESPSSLSLGTK